MNDPRKPDKYHASLDELTHNEEMKVAHDAPIKNVTELIEGALLRVLSALGVDTTQSDAVMKQQQMDLGIVIAERGMEEMGTLAGFYVIDDDIPVAIVRDAFMGSDGLAYVEIYWIQGDKAERFGGVRVIQ